MPHRHATMYAMMRSNCMVAMDISMIILYVMDESKCHCISKCGLFLIISMCVCLQIERYVRDLRVHTILEGTNEIMQLIVAKEMLK
jgi:alkylation response protein AidB-like acyl-CoA dehydrogenase